MQRFQTLLALVATVALTTAHTIITYPGWRGDNLHTNGSVGVDDYTATSGDGYFPYGMQWMYPCGGMPITKNRTYWPIHGGAVAFQPGWFQGHSTAFIYINLGIGSVPPNYSHPMVPVFQITGPTNNAYPGKSVCIPQVGLPANITIKDGDEGTIQVVEAAKHGAALFNCADIIFTSNLSKVPVVNEDNCLNSSSIGFNLVFATASLTNFGQAALSSPHWLGILLIAFSTVLTVSMF